MPLFLYKEVDTKVVGSLCPTRLELLERDSLERASARLLPVFSPEALSARVLIIETVVKNALVQVLPRTTLLSYVVYFFERGRG